MLDIKVEEVLDFEKDLFEFIDTKYPEIPQDIKATRELSKETEDKLKSAIEEFKNAR